ncbi:MAG: FAD:protein FMN transferase [Gammaproteobacteria bacterium]|nr:FAD:protein FMN transferase [Gammaproteobacteria bacterium]
MALLAGACAAPPAPEQLSGQTMGTAYSLRLGELPAGLVLEDLKKPVEAELSAIIAAMSSWEPDSELSIFNDQTGTDWFDVSDGLAFVIDRALTVAELSGGALDVTAAPLVDAWGFGPGSAEPSRPSDEILAAALERVGFQQLKARTDPPALRKLRPDLRVDLSAIAKGFAVDRLAAVLDGAGVKHYLIEIGGELRTRGRRPDGRAWRVGVERPDSSGRSVQSVLEMTANGAIATSGDYRNFFMLDGQRFSHIIDPRTGQPVSHDLASVTVIADNCTDADALATALYVLGPDDAYQLALKRELPVLLITREGDGFSEKSTPAFAKWLGN